GSPGAGGRAQGGPRPPPGCQGRGDRHKRVPGAILWRMGRPALTRAMVVERARELIRADGARATSLRSVARDLGVTAPALYAYVHDYDDLLAAVAEIEFHELEDLFRHVWTDDPVDQLRHLARTSVAHARAEPHLHKLMFRYTAYVPTANTADTTFAPATDAFNAALVSIERAIAADRLHSKDAVLVAFTIF